MGKTEALTRILSPDPDASPLNDDTVMRLQIDAALSW